MSDYEFQRRESSFGLPEFIVFFVFGPLWCYLLLRFLG